jgi:hypothetical protein
MSERNKRYLQTEKGKAAKARAQANYQAKKRGAVLVQEAAIPEENAPTFDYARNEIESRERAIDEANARVFDNHMANGRRGMAVESLCRSLREKVERVEDYLKSVRNDPRTTEEEWAPIAEAVTQAANRYRMVGLWLSQKETLEERKLRLAHGMFLDEGDAGFLKELLFGSPSKEKP